MQDLSALALLFPPQKGEDVWEIAFAHWCPEEDIFKRSKEHRVPHEAWADAKFLEATPGATTDFDFIRKIIIDLSKVFKIQQLGFDVHMARALMSEVRAAGVRVVEVAQGYALDPAIQRIQKLILERRFVGLANPIAKWCFSNVQLKTGVYGNLQLDKDKCREKIDSAAAACIAMLCAINAPQPKSDDYYVVTWV